MTNFPLIVSYYTKDTLYQLEVQNLIASCEKWQLDHHVEPIPSFGSWERNCAYKPFFLMEKLQQFSRPIFWVDADAVFVQEPKALEIFDLDFVARINSDLADTHPSKVMSGSLYINATQELSVCSNPGGKSASILFLIQNAHRKYGIRSRFATPSFAAFPGPKSAPFLCSIWRSSTTPMMKKKLIMLLSGIIRHPAVLKK